MQKNNAEEFNANHAKIKCQNHLSLLYDKIKEFYFKGKNKIHFSNYITSVKSNSTIHRTCKYIISSENINYININ